MKGYSRCSDSPGTQPEGQGILPVDAMPNAVEVMPNPPLGGYAGVGLVMAEEAPGVHIAASAHLTHMFSFLKLRLVEVTLSSSAKWETENFSFVGRCEN